MNCQRAREILPELLDARPPTTEPGATAQSSEIGAARAHLAMCPDCQREFSTLQQTLAALDAVPAGKPSPALRQNFYAMLEAEKQAVTAPAAASASTSRRESPRSPLLRWLIGSLAGCGLAALGFVVGLRVAPTPAPQTVAVADPETKRELHELRTKIEQMETMNQIVAASFAQQQRPATERLRGVVTSASLEKPNDNVIDALIASLALDPSSNVRLRALDALYPYADRDVVRAGVLASLARESNPVVQLSMIDFLAGARDAEAKPALERMSANELVDKSVREAAKRALAQL